MLNSERLPIAVLIFGWLSTITILIPAPWVAGPWLLWSAKVIFLLLGLSISSLALWSGGRWVVGLIAMSAIFIAYWLSEHLFAIRPASESFASVLHAASDLEGFPQFVLIQTQIILPAMHAISMAWLIFLRRRPHIRSTS